MLKGVVGELKEKKGRKKKKTRERNIENQKIVKG